MLWDRPGLGRSDDGPTVTAGALVGLMAELLSRKEAPAILVGHSLGGLHVLCVALEHPELVAGLVLVEPSHHDQIARLGSSRDPALQVAAAAARLPAPIRSGIGSLIAAAGIFLPFDRRTRAMTELAPLVAERLRAVNEEHASTEVFYGFASELIARASLRDLPVEVLTGGDNFADDPSLRADWHAMHEELAGLSSRGVHRIVQGGHDVPFAAPNAVVEAIERVAAATR